MMNITFKALIMASFAILTMASCTKSAEPIGPKGETIINLSKDEVKFTSPNDSTITINVESNVDWVATKEGDDGAIWLTLTPENGKAGIEATTMSIHVTANTSNTQREALVHVSSTKGAGTKELKIIQFPALGKLGKDSLILANFYEAREGWNWKATWILEEPISTWVGVTVAIAGGELRVTALDFQSMGSLNGSLPEEFQEMDQLTKIQCYQNGLSGTLPEWLPNLTKLKSFCVASCGMSGPIPESYWDMTQLKVLQLESNGFTGPLSPKIGQLVNLEQIKLHDCPLGGTIPKSIGLMTSLRDIDLFNCSLTGELPAEIGNAPILENIRFDGNRNITGAIPEEWGNLSKLMMINVSGTSITKLASSLHKCKNFWELDINGCNIEEIPEEWIDATGLEYLRCEGSALKRLPSWKSHSSLISVNIIGCRVEGPIPEFTGSLGHALYAGNKFTGSIPESVVKTKSLQNLSLANCTFLEGEVPSEIWLRPSFTDLDFSNTKLSGVFPTDEQYSDIALGFQEINLDNCKFYGPLPSKLFEMGKIQSVRLANNDFTGPVPASIAYSDQLATLRLNGNKLIGIFPAAIKGHPGWSSVNMWDPIHKICPQQTGYSFEGTTCTEGAPICTPDIHLPN